MRKFKIVRKLKYKTQKTYYGVKEKKLFWKDMSLEFENKMECVNYLFEKYGKNSIIEYDPEW